MFFNDEPAANVVNHEAELEAVVRAGGCVGGTRVRVEVRDDDDCVDTGIVLDAGEDLDAGIGPDAAVCEGGP